MVIFWGKLGWVINSLLMISVVTEANSFVHISIQHMFECLLCTVALAVNETALMELIL